MSDPSSFVSPGSVSLRKASGVLDLSAFSRSAYDLWYHRGQWGAMLNALVGFLNACVLFIFAFILTFRIDWTKTLHCTEAGDNACGTQSMTRPSATMRNIDGFFSFIFAMSFFIGCGANVVWEARKAFVAYYLYKELCKDIEPYIQLGFPTPFHEWINDENSVAGVVWNRLQLSAGKQSAGEEGAAQSSFQRRDADEEMKENPPPQRRQQTKQTQKPGSKKKKKTQRHQSSEQKKAKQRLLPKKSAPSDAALFDEDDTEDVKERRGEQSKRQGQQQPSRVKDDDLEKLLGGDDEHQQANGEEPAHEDESPSEDEEEDDDNEQASGEPDSMDSIAVEERARPAIPTLPLPGQKGDFSGVASQKTTDRRPRLEDLSWGQFCEILTTDCIANFPRGTVLGTVDELDIVQTILEKENVLTSLYSHNFFRRNKTLSYVDDNLLLELIGASLKRDDRDIDPTLVWNAFIVSLVLYPILASFFIVKTFVRHAAEVRSDPTLLFVGDWSRSARWKMRLFNELPFLHEARLRKGRERVHSVFLEIKPHSEILRVSQRIAEIMILFFFILAFFNPAAATEGNFFGSPGAWWMTFFGLSLYAISSWKPQNRGATHYSDLDTIVRDLICEDESWRSSPSAFIQNMEKYFLQTRAWQIVEQVGSILLAPLWLYRLHKSDELRYLAKFIRDYSVIRGREAICVFAAPPSLMASPNASSPTDDKEGFAVQMGSAAVGADEPDQRYSAIAAHGADDLAAQVQRLDPLQFSTTLPHVPITDASSYSANLELLSHKRDVSFVAFAAVHRPWADRKASEGTNEIDAEYFGRIFALPSASADNTFHHKQYNKVVEGVGGNDDANDRAKSDEDASAQAQPGMGSPSPSYSDMFLGSVNHDDHQFADEMVAEWGRAQRARRGGGGGSVPPTPRDTAAAFLRRTNRQGGKRDAGTAGYGGMRQ